MKYVHVYARNTDLLLQLIQAWDFQAEFRNQVLKICFSVSTVFSSTNKDHYPNKERNQITSEEPGFSVSPHHI